MNEDIHLNSLIKALNIVGDELIQQHNCDPTQIQEEGLMRQFLIDKLNDKYQEGFKWWPSEDDASEHAKGGYPSSILLSQYAVRFNNLMGLPRSINNAGPGGKDDGTGFHKIVRDRILSIAWALQRGIDTDMVDILDI